MPDGIRVASRMTSRVQVAALVVVACGSAFVLALALVALIGSDVRPLTVMVLAVVVVAAYGGYRAGLAAAAISAGLSVIILMRADGSAAGLGASEVLNVAVFVAAAVVVSSIVDAVRSAEDVASERQERLEEVAAANAARQAALAKLEHVLAVAPVGIAITDDPGMREIKINEEFARILGARAGTIGSRFAPPGERLTGFRFCRNGAEIAPGDLPLPVAARTGKKVEEHDVDVVRDDGVTLNVLIDAAPLTDDRGEVRGSVAAIVDVTDIRRMERELATSERRLRFALEASPVLISMQDIDLRYIWVPSVCSNPLNRGRIADELKAEDLLGVTDADLLPPEESARTIALKRRVIDSGERERQEVSMTLGGAVHTYDVTVEPVRDDNGVVVGVMGAAFDVTDRKRAEEMLREANRQKDDFVGYVSHELKTPLTLIKGNAWLLGQRGDQLQKTDRADVLRDIEVSADRLDRIIDDLLVLARVTDGQELPREAVLLPDLVRSVVTEHEQGFPHRRIAVLLDGEPGFIDVSTSALRQVLGNLLSNAEKYSPRSEPVEVRISRDGPDVVLTVRDHGSGFSDDEAEKLFTPFYRSPGNAGTAKGLGIGLSVCRRLVEAQDGRIVARPAAEGAGAEFIVSFPAAQLAGAAPAAARV
jgi:signal transduction histidine kinase